MEENHEEACRFGLLQLRNCFGILLLGGGGKRSGDANATPMKRKSRERRGALGKAAVRNIRAISFDVERCIDFAGAPKGGRACCYSGVCPWLWVAGNGEKVLLRFVFTLVG